ncbi:esat-6 like protein EsxE [Mycolicibacterium neworleansense]|uniref:ESAT-6-like protein n=3 Tax=Mycolicibacterium neworleansense TaxID=146018 RepID=A0A0H5RTP7_9MYCO|nr:esat-6 like protein EsxE [Mycolicibacterium neworleansense]
MLIVDRAQLQSAANRMMALERVVDECLGDAEQTMAALRSSWHGDGSDAQAQAQQQWQDGAEQMKAALSALRQILQTAHKNYSDAVDKNGLMWQE